jgi:hypothetical protein
VIYDKVLSVKQGMAAAIPGHTESSATGTRGRRCDARDEEAQLRDGGGDGDAVGVAPGGLAAGALVLDRRW